MFFQDNRKPRAGDALIIVDLQNDFLAGGALPVPEGDAIVPVMNRYVELFQSASLPVIATRCWHPAGHRSFESGGPWPAHCIAWSEGAEFARQLKLPDIDDVVLVSKGTNPATRHPDSGFEETDLEEHLRKQEVQRLFVGGLTLEHAVYATAKDGLARGFDAILLQDAARPRDPRAAERALSELQSLGVDFVDYARIAT
ncbi:MAG: isochorismatase family protein [Gammaproteobacteria bacterium]